MTSMSAVARAAQLAASKGMPLGNGVHGVGSPATIASTQSMAGASPGEVDKRYSVAALYSMVAENDAEVDDDLAKAQRKLRDLKQKISSQSKKNFLLERDVRYLDSRIALLIQNRMQLDENMAAHLEDTEAIDGTFPDDRKRQLYGNLFYLLQAEPQHIATLARLVSLSEIDTLLQTVMFTIYGNQYDSREEYLLLSMFQNVLASQFDLTAEFGNLLRANTPVSRMMTTYTRRGPGQTYLKNTLSKLIHSLLETTEVDLEINPLKVYEQMIQDIEIQTKQPCDLPRGITPEDAMANSDVRAIIAPRVQTLTQIADSFLNTILLSLDQVPYGIRWICKQIKYLTKRKYPDASEFDICSLIGGFFMLRFVNPAIVTPQSHMLVDSIPGKNPRRTLTLVAKVLQNLANKPTYAREMYMMELNPFVEASKIRITKFLLDLCEVGDFYEALEMDQYVALSKKEIQLNINLNEIYQTHSLLTQHMDVLCPNEKQHLRVCLTDVGPAPPQVPREENKSIILPLFSRWETAISENPSAHADQLTQGDILYMDTKAIFVQIQRTMPHLAKPPINLHRISEAAATSREPAMVKKGLKVREMLKQLESMKIYDHALMVEEVSVELAHLGNLREKVNVEMKSLDAVYKTIIEHNNYLRSQLEHYKAYLQNVRGKAAGSTVEKVKFTYAQLERDFVIVESNVPENRRPHIYFNLTSEVQGTFIIALHFKGRDKALLEMDLKLDDLLEKQSRGETNLDLEYVQLNVGKILQLLNKTFLKK